MSDSLALPTRVGGNLYLREEDSGLRHYLEGKPVHCGEFIEIQLGGRRGPWVVVRYEANLSRQGVTVCLYAVGGRIYADEDATFRWPDTL